MSGISDPAPKGRTINTGTDTVLPTWADFLYVWTPGNLAFVTTGGDVIGPFPVVAGQVVPYRAKKILAATTATITTGEH